MRCNKGDVWQQIDCDLKWMGRLCWVAGFALAVLLICGVLLFIMALAGNPNA